MPKEKKEWIDEVELEDIQVKWAFSHFDGREDTFNAAGDHNFTIILPDDVAEEMLKDGWNVKTQPGYEEGDPPENLLQVKISYRFEPPKIYLIKGDRKMRANEIDLSDIRRDTCERIDVILQPSPWVHGNRSGITAYAKELYAQVKESRFSAMYADYEEI